MKEITQEYLKSLFFYDEKTGLFHRKIYVQSRSMAGYIAGTVSKNKTGNKYIKISINNKRYYAHRLAWLYFYGDTPNIIDHINGNGVDNRIDNLRSVTTICNAKNQKIRSDNTTGVVGVSAARNGRWRAYISVDGCRIALGQYSNFDEAVKIRKDAEIKYNYHKNHGRGICKEK